MRRVAVTTLEQLPKQLPTLDQSHQVVSRAVELQQIETMGAATGVRAAHQRVEIGKAVRVAGVNLRVEDQGGNRQSGTVSAIDLKRVVTSLPLRV